PERGLASARLADALASTYCAGVHSNERWLRRILRSARFLEVRHDVALLDQAAGEFAGPPAAAPEALILAALALHAGEGGAAPREPGAGVHLWTADEPYELLLEDPRTHEFSPSAATGGLTTPLPGVVVAVPVAVGQKVSAGEVLMVIEAMKMEHAITAPYAGTVETIH